MPPGPGVTTVTSTTPVPAGLVAVICVAELTTTLVAAVVPKFTAVAPVKSVPVIVTVVPPADGTRRRADARHHGLVLARADVNDVPRPFARETGPALVRGQSGRIGAPGNGRAAEQQGAGLGRPAVVGQRSEHRINGPVGIADQVSLASGVRPGPGQAGARIVAHQTMGNVNGAGKIGRAAAELSVFPAIMVLWTVGGVVGVEE